VVDEQREPPGVTAAIEARLTRLDDLTRREILATQGTEEAESQLGELERMRDLRASVNDILERSRAAQQKANQGEKMEALQTLAGADGKSQILRLSRLMEQALTEERADTALHQRRMKRLRINLLSLALAGLVLQVVIAVIVGLWVRRSLLHPVNQLVAGIRRLGRGDLTLRIPPTGHDEFTLLHSHINRMAGQMERNRQKLLESKSWLESEVQARTLSLVEKNLELQTIDASRRRFFADVSHELRTPLTTIQGEADIALRSTSTDPQRYREALSRILSSSALLTRRIADLLTLARSGEGRLILTFQPIDLRSIVEEAVEDMQRLALNSDITLRADLKVSSALISGEASWLKQCLLTLMDNALKFSRPGQSIEITLEGDETEAIVSIQDHGEGIPSEDLPHLFERFFQGERGRHFGGTGLGLAVAQWITLEHGGIIEAESRMGEGTVIRMRFPKLSPIAI